MTNFIIYNFIYTHIIVCIYFFTKEGEIMQENNLKGLWIPYEILTNEKVRYLNNNMLDNEIHFIDNDYKANLQDGVLSLYIPEKLPNLTNRSSYAHKQIIFNIAEITKQYDKLFFDKYVIVIIKIFEKLKVWDADNRTVKPIQDGLIHGGVIKDDNIFNCCYMVQGFYSDLPHIEVSVLEADKIINFIDSNLPNISKWP